MKLTLRPRKSPNLPANTPTKPKSMRKTPPSVSKPRHSTIKRTRNDHYSPPAAHRKERFGTPTPRSRSHAESTRKLDYGMNDMGAAKMDDIGGKRKRVSSKEAEKEQPAKKIAKIMSSSEENVKSSGPEEVSPAGSRGSMGSVKVVSIESKLEAGISKSIFMMISSSALTSLRPTDDICYNCGRNGHSFMGCVVKCGHCRQSGHRTIDCMVIGRFVLGNMGA